jgi:Trk K+ transport system NAD-binding subunit
MDASMPENLVSAGLQSRWCLGVLAVTADDRVNLKIAVTARLLNQRAAAYARADEGEAADNMRSFDTSHVVRPAEEFVYRLCLLLTRPNSYRLYQWLRSSPEHGLPVQREVAKGRWILCGFGRFGRAVYRAMRELNLPVTVIEENSSLEGLPEDYVVGRGTQAETLQAAGIGDAVGILATTQDDVDNLSILITARSLKSDLFCGAVANRWTNSPLFEAANPEFVAQPGELIAGTILSHIRSPLLSHLFQRLEETSDDEAGRILSLLAPSADSVRQPEFLTVRLSKNRAPALYALLTAGQTLKLELFSRHPVRLGERLEVEVLMLSRGDQDQLLPALDTEMESGDRLLLACSPSAARRVRVLLESEAVAYKTVTGQELQQGWLFRKLAGAGTDLRS